MALQQAAFGKAEDLVAGHHEVVEHVHVHQPQCAFERLGQVLVGPAGVGTAARVVVGQHDGGRVECERRLDHFPRIERGLGQGAAEHRHRVDQHVASIQVQHQEHLVFEAGTVQAQPVTQGLG